jgi:hypothetical protein
LLLAFMNKPKCGESSASPARFQTPVEFALMAIRNALTEGISAKEAARATPLRALSRASDESPARNSATNKTSRAKRLPTTTLAANRPLTWTRRWSATTFRRRSGRRAARFETAIAGACHGDRWDL